MKCQRCPSDAHTRGHCEPCYRYLLHTGRFADDALENVAETFVHLHRLRELHWTWQQIGAASEVPFGHISAIARGEYATVRGGTARKILAVPLVESSWHHGVDPTGTRRRIQAMQWMGWPAREIAERVGVKTETISTVSHRGGGRGRVSSRLARAIANIYEDLSGLPGPSRQSATKARAYGYAPPLAWDDDTIDDPKRRPRGIRRAAA